jgi:hypothetical protein
MSGMLMYAFYYYWRSATGGEASFVLYILAATIYNVYACIWVCTGFAFISAPDFDTPQDYLTDWSLLRPQAKYPLLRDEVLCTDHLYVS